MRLRLTHARLQAFAVNRVKAVFRKDRGVFRPNLLLRIMIGLCMWGLIVGGTALAESRTVPVAGGGELQAQVKATAIKVIPAVVSIASTVMVRDQAFSDEALPFGLFKDVPSRRQYGQGSGVIVSSDGYIMTNNHVIADAVDVEVILADRRQYQRTGGGH